MDGDGEGNAQKKRDKREELMPGFAHMQPVLAKGRTLSARHWRDAARQKDGGSVRENRDQVASTQTKTK